MPRLFGTDGARGGQQRAYLRAGHENRTAAAVVLAGRVKAVRKFS